MNRANRDGTPRQWRSQEEEGEEEEEEALMHVLERRPSDRKSGSEGSESSRRT